jgi:hypothetical protein
MKLALKRNAMGEYSRFIENAVIAGLKNDYTDF